MEQRDLLAILKSMQINSTGLMIGMSAANRQLSKLIALIENASALPQVIKEDTVIDFILAPLRAEEAYQDYKQTLKPAMQYMEGFNKDLLDMLRSEK